MWGCTPARLDISPLRWAGACSHSMPETSRATATWSKKIQKRVSSLIQCLHLAGRAIQDRHETYLGMTSSRISRRSSLSSRDSCRIWGMWWLNWQSRCEIGSKHPPRARNSQAKRLPSHWSTTIQEQEVAIFWPRMLRRQTRSELGHEEDEVIRNRSIANKSLLLPNHSHLSPICAERVKISWTKSRI